MLSEENSDFISKWKLMYDDYDFILWNDKMVENIITKDFEKYYFNKDIPLAFKADVLRYRILQKFGGIYLDVDMEPLKKFVVEKDIKFFSAKQSNGEIAIGIIGCEKNNKLINEINEKIFINVENKLSNNITFLEVHKLTGPSFFTEICNIYEGVHGYVFYESKYFYPYWFLEKNRRNEDFRITCPDAYAVHHWNHSWK